MRQNKTERSQQLVRASSTILLKQFYSSANKNQGNIGPSHDTPRALIPSRIQSYLAPQTNI